jgi:hypothetical protein
MRLLRLRRRDGVACCVTIEVFRVEIEVWIRQGLLEHGQVQDRRAVRRAVGKILENWFEQG